MNYATYLSSPHQQRLWFIDHFETGYVYPTNPTYHNMPVIIEYSSYPDWSQLILALQDVVNKHEILRTVLKRDEDELKQCVLGELVVKITEQRVVEVTHPPISDSQINDFIQQPFDFNETALWRARLFYTDDCHAVFVLVLHHAIADRHSLSVIAHELLSCLTEKHLVVDQSQKQYNDFVVWQHSLPEKQVKTMLLFWRKTLSNQPPRIELYTDIKRPLIHVFKSAVHTCKLATDHKQVIDTWCATHQITPSSVFLAAYCWLLYNYSAQNDLLLGCLFDPRESLHLNALGPVSNLIPLRVLIDVESDFVTLCQLVQKHQQQAQQCGYLPFEQLVNALNPEKDMSRLALFDVLYHFESLESDDARIIIPNVGLGKYDLNLLVSEECDAYSITLNFNALYFVADRMFQFLDSLMRFVPQAIQNSQKAMNSIPLLSFAQQQGLIAASRRYTAIFATDTTIMDVFQQQVQAFPDRVAVSSATISLSYRELDDRSLIVMERINQQCTSSQSVIAVLMKPSVNLIVTLLAILKLNHIYLPLDPDYPAQRLAFILDDAATDLMIIDNSIISDAYSSYQQINIDSLNYDKVAVTQHLLATQQSLAYIIYTSGTTGQPKGVGITHQNLYRLFFNSEACWSFSEQDRWCLLHSHGFDFSVWEIFGALLFGGQCCIPLRDEIQNPNLLANFIVTNGITVLNQTPSAFYNLADYICSNTLVLPLREIIFGGENVLSGKLSHFSKCYPEIRLINMYGITEGTIHVTYHVITSLDISNNRSTIGEALPTCACYVLDHNRRLVPNGVPGELYIGGECVVKGYLNRADLMVERFIILSDIDDRVIYKTGDWVIRDHDGNLNYISRIDNQVQCRGYRIELGEIESALMQVDGIGAVHANLYQDKGDVEHICAYIQTKQTYDIAQLQHKLSAIIPAFMIPDYFIFMQQLPLTVNGKIDPLQLPKPTKSLTNSHIRTPAENPSQQTLLESMQRVLDLDEIGIDDNFFELGGNSLNAVRVIAEINQTLSSAIKLSDFFQSPTARKLSKLLSFEIINKSDFTKAEMKDYYLVSSSQKRLLILSQFDNVDTTYNVYRVYQSSKPLDYSLLSQACHTLINRHESLRTSFHFIGDHAVQKIQETVHFELIQLINHQSNITDIVAGLVKPFDLTTAPLFRAYYVIDANENQFIVFDSHHIIVDGIAMAQLENELLALYHGEALQPLTYQYKDFSEWQNNKLSQYAFSTQKDFWLHQLAHPIPVLNLITDYTRPTSMDFHGDVFSFSLDETVFKQLLVMTQKYQCTEYMLLLSMFFVLLHKMTGQDDFIVGCTISGRTIPEAQEMVGHFLNMLPMRAQPTSHLSFIEFLEQVKQHSLQAFENQDYPFELLIDELSISRNIARNPLFDVVFIYQNFLKNQQQFEIQYRDVYRNKTSKHDLSLYAVVTDGRLSFEFEYATALFNEKTMQYMARHLCHVIHQIIENPTGVLRDISLVDEDEREYLLHRLNSTTSPLAQQDSIAARFARTVQQYPTLVALMHANQTLDYATLDLRSNQVAHFLQETVSIQPQVCVAVLMEKSLQCMVAIWGIIKAEAIYVPLDTTYPYGRIKQMLSGCDVSVLISEKRFIRDLNRLQWELPHLQHIVCMDSDAILLESEFEQNEKMSEALWDYISDTANDDIVEGGWKSSYTNQPFSGQEMLEFQHNIYTKLLPHVSATSRVLEIGIGSGFSLYKLAPMVQRYVGTDLSQRVIEKNKEKLNQQPIPQVDLYHLPAHDTAPLQQQGPYDIVIINSVVQSFHGHNYLRKLLTDVVGMCSDKAVIFLGDLLDQTLKQEFIDSLKLFKDQNQDIQTKLDWDSELFIARDFIEGLKVHYPITSVEFSSKIHTIQNELTQYRFDAILSIDKCCDRFVIDHKYHQYDATHINRCSSAPVLTHSSPNHLAYIIHTSGTTGKPKGVAVSQQAIMNLLDWVNREYQVGPDDRLLQLTSLCFDLSIYDIFGILTSGGSLYLPMLSERSEPEAILKTVVDKGITFWNSAPAVLFQLSPLFQDWKTKLARSKLRLVFLSGDWIPTTLPGLITQYVNQARCITLGGATEATVWSNYYEAKQIPSHHRSVPYGRPIQNSQYYVLDDALQPCAVGVAGRLYIGGICLAEGYFNDPVQTSEKFIQNPFATGERLYDTADYARVMSDGQIEFLGRKDNQVKIRGYRIETGEIEQSLLQLDGVQQVYIAVVEESRYEKALCAYIQVAQSYDIQSLKAHLSRVLPNYMVPAFFVCLPQFPLTGNGKIDYKKLPNPKQHLNDSQYVPPIRHTPTQKIISDIWQAELNLSHINPSQNFFDLGGNSLKIVKVGHSLKQRLGKDVPVVLLFQYPTIQALAAVLDNDGVVQEMPKKNTSLERGKSLLKSGKMRRQHVTVEDEV